MLQSFITVITEYVVMCAGCTVLQQLISIIS